MKVCKSCVGEDRSVWFHCVVRGGKVEVEGARDAGIFKILGIWVEWC